jgi:hypothetical protein
MDASRRRRWWAVAWTSLATGCGGSGGGSSGPPDPPPACAGESFSDGFEAGVDAWEKGFDLPEDPNRPGEPVAWSIEPSTEQAFDGTTSARYDLDGRQDDGTIWLVRAFDAPPSSGVVVRLRFRLWSETESFNDLARVAAYAGVVPPAVEADFDLSGRANDVAGWAPYEYAFPLSTDASGRVHVAFGISAVFETQMTYFVDAVEVCVD